MYQINPHHSPEQAARIKAHNALAEAKSAACVAYGLSDASVVALSELQGASRAALVADRTVAF